MKAKEIRDLIDFISSTGLEEVNIVLGTTTSLQEQGVSVPANLLVPDKENIKVMLLPSQSILSQLINNFKHVGVF